MSEGQGEAPHYRAFISYSHKDERAAARLHRWLETYRLPGRLVGGATAHGPVPRRLTPIFRDRAELSAASSLDAEVRAALSRSQALLVLCSPAARQSYWVGAEIALFRALHPDRPIIAALLEGEPADSFPAALLEPGADGQVREPIAADFRTDQDGARLARLKIVAGLTGVALDQIIQREAQRQLRRVIAVTLITLFMTLFMALMLVLAVRAQREADRQRRQAEGLIEFMLTDLREKLQGVGRLEILQTVNRRALSYYADQSDLADLPPDSLERRARILHAMGEDDHRLGNKAEALAKFREAHRVTAALLAADPDDPQRIFAHAQSEYWLGYVDFIDSRYAQAQPRFEAYRQLAGQLVQRAPDKAEYWQELGYAQGNLCAIAVDRKAPNDGLAHCRHALDTMRRVAHMLPQDPGVRVNLAVRHAWLADALRLEGRNADALRERERQMALLQALLAEDPKNASYRQDWMLARHATARLLYAMGDRDRALRLRQEALQEVTRLLAADPDNQDWQIWRRQLERPLDQQKE